MFQYEAEKKILNIEDLVFSHTFWFLGFFGFFWYVSSPHCLEVIKYSSDTNLDSVSHSFPWAEIPVTV